MPGNVIKDLSDREVEILRLVARGASNKEIAHELFISANTVKVHLRNIFTKIGASSRTEAAMYAVKTGIVITLPPEISINENQNNQNTSPQKKISGFQESSDSAMQDEKNQNSTELVDLASNKSSLRRKQLRILAFFLIIFFVSLSLMIVWWRSRLPPNGIKNQVIPT